MIIRIFLVLTLVVSLYANEIKNLNFGGNIDLVLGDFSTSNLNKVCNITYPPFYKFWQKNPTFSLYDIQICEELLVEYAQSLGFYEADIITIIKDNKATINIIKNRPIMINSIEIDEKYKKLIDIEVNKQFTTINFSNSKKAITGHLAKVGYPKAELDAKAYVDIDEYKVDIVYKVIKNNPQYFGDITIDNDARIDLEYIEKEVKFKKGELYNSLLIDSTYEGLYNFGIFKYISIDQDLDTTDDVIPVNIKLLEGAYRETMYSIGYDTNTGGRLKAQYKNDNFLGNLKKFTIGTNINQDGYKIYNNFYNPYFYLDGVSINNDITYEDMDYLSYKQRKIEEQIAISKDIFGLTHSIGLLSEHSKIKSKLQEYESGNYLLNSLFYNAIMDRRDSALNPKNGYYLSFYIENGTQSLGSEIEYLKTLTEFRYIKSFDKLTTSFKTIVGSIDHDLPIFKHFFAGGDYSNRGYTYQKVGVLDSEDNPYGGLSMIDSTIEFEYNIYKDIGIATFLDSTMLSQKSNSFNERFYNSVGIGARYYTPIGPLRVDFGFPLRDSGFVFHIGIGQVF
ncbi:MAG: BamA/TamA family outer membrane protein [Arcobacteraceae bacterium]|nr:BamA/TamA family outer membrane protein [Arcobacteraceae bacterium]